MPQSSSLNSNRPSEPPRRSPLDAVWFTILFLSIATGIGMTIFAPVGNELPPAAAAGPAPNNSTTTTTPTTATTATTPTTALPIMPPSTQLVPPAPPALVTQPTTSPAPAP